MIKDEALTRYLSALLTGDRYACRRVVEEALQRGVPANCVYLEMIWPIVTTIEKLVRQDRISPVQEHLASRINRTIVDQLQNKLPRRPGKGKRIVVCCAPDELQELGAQMLTDLFESDGWDVRFPGGGLTNDDILAYIHEFSPSILLIYGTSPRQAPDIRRLIDTIKSVNAWPDMRIMVSGGLFGRAEGLWQEMEADLYAADPLEALNLASGETPASHGQQRTINRRRKRPQPTQQTTPMLV